MHDDIGNLLPMETRVLIQSAPTLSAFYDASLQVQVKFDSDRPSGLRDT